jgi:serine/threonine-protein kinase
VIRVDPAPGTEVPPDQAITLVVSAGREKVSVPRVEGLSEDNARRLIESAGLSVEVSDQEVQNQDQDGTVLTQSPAPNAQVELGSTVNIVVGRYFPPLPGEGGGGG